MSPTILARELDGIIATLADMGDYIICEDEREPGSDRDQRNLETWCADALRHAVQARRSID